MMVLALGLSLLFAQQGTIYGWVRAEGSLEPVAFAAVEPVGGRAVLTDEHGYYVLPRVPTGEVRVRVSVLGYGASDSTVVVNDGGRVRLDFTLPTRPVTLEDIRVQGGSEEMASVATPGPPPMRIDAPTIGLAPGVAEKDAFRAIQMLPSVAAASDFSSALYVRGGSPDQTIVLLDGAPVFNPYHLAGLFSAIDPDAISNIELLPGGMPATEGDRASGVVKIWTRDGGRDRVRGHGALGLVSSRFGVDGPLPTDGGTYLISVRRTYFDLMTRGAYELGLIDTPFPYAFTDAHAKITQDVGRTGRLNVSGYINDERVHTPREVSPNDRTSFSWGTRAGSIAYRQPMGSILAEVTLAATSFDGRFESIQYWSMDAGPPEADTSFIGLLTMRDIVTDARLTWYGGGHELKAGVQLDLYDFRYRFILEDQVITDPAGDDDDPIRDIFAILGETAGITTIAGYVEDEWTLTERLAFRAGVRALHAPGVDTDVMPRVGLRWSLSDDLNLTAAAGRYAQGIHSLRNEESVLSSIMPYELLVPASAETGFLVSEDVTLGLEYRQPNTRLRADGYYKRYPTLPTTPLSDDPMNAPIFATGFEGGSGWASGLELFVQHRRGKSVVMGSYALTWAERSLGDEAYTPRYQRRHMADITGGLEWGDGGLLTARVAAATGQPFTPALARTTRFMWDPYTQTYQPMNSPVVYGEHNTERLPAYFRLDLGVRNEGVRTWFGREFTIVPYFQVLNVLGNKNVVAGQPQYNFEGATEVQYLPAMPTLPTFGVEWRF